MGYTYPLWLEVIAMGGGGGGLKILFCGTFLPPPHTQTEKLLLINSVLSKFWLFIDFKNIFSNKEFF